MILAYITYPPSGKATMLPNHAPEVEEPTILVRSAFGAQHTKIALIAGLLFFMYYFKNQVRMIHWFQISIEFNIADKKVPNLVNLIYLSHIENKPAV